MYLYPFTYVLFVQYTILNAFSVLQITLRRYQETVFTCMEASVNTEAASGN